MLKNSRHEHHLEKHKESKTTKFTCFEKATDITDKGRFATAPLTNYSLIWMELYYCSGRIRSHHHHNFKCKMSTAEHRPTAKFPE